MRRIILAAAAPLLLTIGTSAAAAPPAWRVSETAGDVRLVENGRARPATRGALLSSGSVIATGANARAVIVRGQEFVVISPRSQMRVPATEESRGGLMQMIADFGTGLFRIEKKSTPHFGVKTPYLAAVVKGTTFTVTVGPEGGSVQVTEGAVEVSTLDGGAAELVRPGDIAQVAAGDLYRLSIEGETSRVVQSPAGAGTVTSSAAPAPAAAVYSGPPSARAEIARAVAEERQSLSELTDGLLEGTSPADMVLANLNIEARRTAHRDDEAAGGGNGGGNGNGGTGNGPGNGNGGNDNGNGNGGGNGGGKDDGDKGGGGKDGGGKDGGDKDGGDKGGGDKDGGGKDDGDKDDGDKDDGDKDDGDKDGGDKDDGDKDEGDKDGGDKDGGDKDEGDKDGGDKDGGDKDDGDKDDDDDGKTKD